MFIKFLDHDLRYGIGRAKKRLIVTFSSSQIRNIWNLLLQRQTISWH